jgi:hypothetical protein
MKKHLKFIEMNTEYHGIMYHVINIYGESLGFLEYYKKWKCFTWEQNDGVIMSKSCLDELTEYMGKLDANKKYGVFGKKGDGKTLLA